VLLAELLIQLVLYLTAEGIICPRGDVTGEQIEISLRKLRYRQHY